MEAVVVWITEAFPLVTLEDLAELAYGSPEDAIQATDREGTVCRITYDKQSGLFLVTDNF